MFPESIFLDSFSFFNPRPGEHNHQLLVVCTGNAKDLSRLPKQVMWMCCLHNTCWSEEKQCSTVWVPPALFPLQVPWRRQVSHPLPACLFNKMRICVCLSPLHARPTRAPLSPCVFCNMRTSVSELGAKTQEETGSPERGQQDALADTVLTPADMDTRGHLGESHATLHGLVSASLTFLNKRREHPRGWCGFQKKAG